MSTLHDIFDTALAAAVDAVAGIPVDIATAKALDDRELLRAQSRLGQLKSLIDSRSAVLAGEIAFRSRRELGYQGLAQRQGFQTPEKLVQHTTGSTRREAGTLVSVGTIVHEASSAAAHPDTGEFPLGFVAKEPWLVAVGVAVASGTLTVEGATAIRNGLGSPSAFDGSPTGADIPNGVDLVTVDQLIEAVQALLQLVQRAEGTPGLDADALFRRARELRDELDESGIAKRERIIYERRAFRRVKRQNGQSRFIIDGDIETSSWLDDLYDKLTSPRRGGPRFIDRTDQDWANAIANDTRTSDQYLHDAVIGLLRKGVDTDHAEDQARTNGRGSTLRIVGSRLPAVRVLVTEEALRARQGHGRLEGSEVPVSIDTVERILCTSGTVPVAFGQDGNVIDLGRESRLFSAGQKVALSVRDGGCLWTGCDRPASWTEAHHINQWARDNGKTDLADGILLCRHHHLLLHNNHWEIERHNHDYWLIPPPDIDPNRTPRKLSSKSPTLHELQRERQRAG